jgi:2-polyprenyl-6-methoxyphenol hydroxylase-like FAD-dependent oxidoreductase
MTDVIIIGAGIGGLTTAIALRQRGIAATVYEAAPAFKPLGAGIWVPPNAMEVLARLGLGAAICAGGRALRAAAISDADGRTIQRAELPPTPTGTFPAVAIHRARLHEALLAALDQPVQLGKACAGIEQDARQATVRFADGSSASAACVIGADGLRSVVRQGLFPEARLRYSGQSSYRAVAAATLPGELDGQELWGAGRRFGYSDIGSGQVYWYATFDAPAGQHEPPQAAASRLAGLFAGFPAPIPALIAATSPEQILRTDIFDCQPLASWHRGRIGLIGDAAHAATPNLGQGGAQAIEDAYVLAAALADHRADPAAAFSAFERQRRAKALLVVRRAWQLGKLAHWSNPLARRLRNSLIRLTPPRLAARQLAELYQLNY